MKISKITIDNFCSIEHAEFAPTEFNVLVGQNNHGKTNVFEAVSWFYYGKGDLEKLRFGRTGGAEVSVEIEFDGVQAALPGMRNPKNATSIQNVIGAEDTIRIRRIGSELKTRKIFSSAKSDWVNVTGIDPALNDLLPLLEYIDTGTRLNDVAKFSKTSPVGTMLSGVLMALLENSQAYKEFRQKFDELFTSPASDVCVELTKMGTEVKVYIAKQFPDCTKVSFKISEPAFEDLLKGFTTDIDDGIETDADEKGDGMQRALMLAILQAYVDFRKKGEANGKGFIFLIDEAELHLHPSAQRNLKEALRDISRDGDQVLINTHSSVLVADDFPEQQIFCVEKSQRKTSVHPVLTSDKPSIVYELLGGSPNDLLLPRNFLIVEGKSDFIFISTVIRRFYADRPSVAIIFAEGDFEKQRSSMNALNTLFAPLMQRALYRDRAVILCDAANDTNRGDFQNFLNAYQAQVSNGQIQVLPQPSLEEYYPASYRRTAAEVHANRATPRWKRDLAAEAGSAVSQADFESDMAVIKVALDRCWAEAFA